MAFNKALTLLLVLAVAAAPLASAIITRPLNANTNVRCCGTEGYCVDTDNQCSPVGVNSCCKVADTLSKGTNVRAICYVRGQSIYGNNRWLVIDQPRRGYVSDYYVSCGGPCPVLACN